MKTIFLALLLAASLPVLATAQRSTMPGVVVNENGTSTTLRVVKLDVSVRITGTLAVTTMDMTVHNPFPRILEGEFEFPITEGQTISRFALDINGHVRDGVVVPKEKARATFETIIKRKVDPALMEWTRGNTFRSRIYPLPANGTRRIVIAYEQQLRASSDGYLYSLPFAFTDTVRTFSFVMDVAAFGTRPVLSGSDWKNVDFTPNGRTYHAETHLENAVIDRLFQCLIPVTSGKTFTAVNDFDGRKYFATFLGIPSQRTRRIAPSRITLAWDASLSGMKRDIDKELNVLDNFFRLYPNVDVTLAPFAIGALPVQKFRITSGNWSALRTALRSMVYDGGTQFAIAPLARGGTDLYLLFSDGISTFGAASAPPGDAEVITIASSTTANHASLSDIARRSGGSYLNLAEGTIDDAVDLLAYRPIRLASVRVEQGDVDGLYPVGGQVTNDMITVGGILKSDEAVIELQFESGPGTARLERIRISGREDFDSGTTVARLWAHSELDRYGADPVRNEAAITAIGQRFGIVTQGTSLIVLELLDDYVRFNIAPPASEPALLAQWTERRKGIVDDSVRRRSLHKEEMLALWNQRRQWYDKVFEPYVPPVAHIPMREPDSTAFTFKTPVPLKTRNGTTGILRGLVTGTDGKPVSGATVRILGTTRGGLTRNNGTYYITNVPAGDYTVRINMPVNGVVRDTVSTNLTVLPGHEQTVDARFRRGVIDFYESNGAMDRERPLPAASAKGNGFNIRGSRASGTVVRTQAVEITDQLSDGFAAGSGNAAAPVVEAEVSLRADDVTLTETARALTTPLPAAPESSDALMPAKSSRNREGTTDRLKKEATAATTSGRIMLIDSDSTTSYLSAMKAAKPADAYRIYLTLRPQYENSPQFYLDAADILRSKGRLDEALRVISNIAELKAEDHEQLRVLASRLLQLGHADLAVLMYEDVLRIRGEEPQSYRDLGLALAAAKRYPDAIRYLYAVVDRPWDNRFPEVEMIALNELNHLVAKNGLSVDTTVVDPRFIGNMPVDVRIVLAWDADNTDVDMWVTDPSGEKCFYGHRETTIGGRISRDLTGGYGPEEFLLKNAAKGAYKVQANYYGNSRQRASGPATIQLELYTHYGKPNETKKTITLPLTGNRQTLDIGTLMME